MARFTLVVLLLLSPRLVEANTFTLTGGTASGGSDGIFTEAFVNASGPEGSFHADNTLLVIGSAVVLMHHRSAPRLNR